VQQPAEEARRINFPAHRLMGATRKQQTKADNHQQRACGMCAPMANAGIAGQLDEWYVCCTNGCVPFRAPTDTTVMSQPPTFLMIAFLVGIIIASVLGRGVYIGSETVPRPSPDGIVWFMECLYLYPGNIRHVPVGMGKTVKDALDSHICKSFDR